MSARRGDWLQSWSIGQLWPLDMRPEDIRIADIGNALSKLCRFSGHVHHFYSVAQHCVLVSQECERRALVEGLSAERVLHYARWGLAHDWTEGLGLVDLARGGQTLLTGAVVKNPGVAR